MKNFVFTTCNSSIYHVLIHTLMKFGYDTTKVDRIQVDSCNNFLETIRIVGREDGRVYFITTDVKLSANMFTRLDELIVYLSSDNPSSANTELAKKAVININLLSKHSDILVLNRSEWKAIMFEVPELKYFLDKCLAE